MKVCCFLITCLEALERLQSQEDLWYLLEQEDVTGDGDTTNGLAMGTARKEASEHIRVDDQNIARESHTSGQGMPSLLVKYGPSSSRFPPCTAPETLEMISAGPSLELCMWLARFPRDSAAVLLVMIVCLIDSSGCWVMLNGLLLPDAILFASNSVTDLRRM